MSATALMLKGPSMFSRFTPTTSQGVHYPGQDEDPEHAWDARAIHSTHGSAHLVQRG